MKRVSCELRNLALIVTALAAILAGSTAKAAVRCEWLFSAEKPEGGDYQANPAVLPADARGKNTATWLKDSFFDIVEHFPFSSRYHSSQFSELDRALTSAGFLRGEVFVNEHSHGSFHVRVRYNHPHPTIRDRNMTVESNVYFFTGDLMSQRDGGPTLWEQNSDFRVVGITDAKTDFVRRERGRRETRERFLAGFRAAGNQFDQRQSDPWTNHLRRVLKEILVPLAISDPSVLEVGIGFNPEATIYESGKIGALPQLILNRARGYFHRGDAAALLLHARGSHDRTRRGSSR